MTSIKKERGLWGTMARKRLFEEIYKHVKPFSGRAERGKILDSILLSSFVSLGRGRPHRALKALIKPLRAL